jgi:prepilin-type N-terminal cleavage/methylation domain-containing protein
MFIKNRKKLNKRGFTLVELTVVMAITAIISVMIVTTATLISAQVKKNGLRADFMQSVVDFRSDLQIQFAEVDGTSPTFTVTEDNKSIQFENTTISLDSYEYIDRIEIKTQGEILKVTLTNARLEESQSFVLISKTSGTFEKP